MSSSSTLVAITVKTNQSDEDDDHLPMKHQELPVNKNELMNGARDESSDKIGSWSDPRDSTTTRHEGKKAPPAGSEDALLRARVTNNGVDIKSLPMIFPPPSLSLSFSFLFSLVTLVLLD